MQLTILPNLPKYSRAPNTISRSNNDKLLFAYDDEQDGRVSDHKTMHRLLIATVKHYITGSMYVFHDNTVEHRPG